MAERIGSIDADDQPFAARSIGRPRVGSIAVLVFLAFFWAALIAGVFGWLGAP